MKPLWKQHRKAKFFSFGVSDKEKDVTFSVVKDVTGWEDMLSFVKGTREQDLDFETQENKGYYSYSMDDFHPHHKKHLFYF
jgi:hypothetical protein